MLGSNDFGIHFLGFSGIFYGVQLRIYPIAISIDYRERLLLPPSISIGFFIFKFKYSFSFSIMPDFWPVDDEYSGIANAITNEEKSFNDELQFAKGDCYFGVRKIIEPGGAHYYDLCFFPLAITMVKDDELKNYSLSFACFFIDLSLMMNCAKSWS